MPLSASISVQGTGYKLVANGWWAQPATRKQVTKAPIVTLVHVRTNIGRRDRLSHVQRLVPFDEEQSSFCCLVFFLPIVHCIISTLLCWWTLWTWFITLNGGHIPHICHRHHRRCLCKKFLSGVDFSRLSEKKCIYIFFFRELGRLNCPQYDVTI